MTDGTVRFSVLVASTERLDRFLADQLGISRTQSARLVAAHAVQVDGTTARASRTLTRAEVVELTPPPGEPPRVLLPHDIPLDIRYEDDALAVIDKPAGLVVHPAPGHWDGTLVNALVARGTTLRGGAEGRPGIVHRLDRDTSGLLVIAKTDAAHRALSSMIAARQVTRLYAALVWGHLAQDREVIDAPIGRDLRDRKRMAILARGRPARTVVTVIARFPSADLVRVQLHTGRTHQIRVHLESIGHPVVGDLVYGAGGWKRIGGTARAAARHWEALAPRQALHAAILAFRHPVSGLPLTVSAPWPADLWPLLQAAVGAEGFDRMDALAALGFGDAD